MTALCWFCGSRLADPKAAYRASLWADAKAPPASGNHPVRAAHRRYVTLEIPLESCERCASYRRRGRFGLWMGPVLGAVLAPILYRAAADRVHLPLSDTPYDTLMIASASGAALGFMGGVLLALALSRRPAGEPRPRLPQDHPEVRRMIALGWSWDSPFSD